MENYLDKFLFMEKILRLVIYVAILISLSVFICQSVTADRWQEKAINNYNSAILSNQKPEYQPESWWTQNPLVVGFSVWLFDTNNLISIFFGFFSYLIRYFGLKSRIFNLFHIS